MIQETFRIADPIGFHARPAAIAVNIASKQKCSVMISYSGRSVDMKSLIGVLSLGMPYGAHFSVICNGEEEEAALINIKEVMIDQRLIENTD